MTILSQPAMNWRTDPRTANKFTEPQWNRHSPNLLALTTHLREDFGGGNMGIHFDRDTTSGVVSEHSWGAGLDHGTLPEQVNWLKSVGRATGRATTLAEHHAMCDWVVAHSKELQIDAIVSIGRAWRSDRIGNGAGGWKPYSSGYTGHSHFVTTYAGWGNATPIKDRLTPGQPGDNDMTPIDGVRIYDTRSYGKRMEAGVASTVDLAFAKAVPADATGIMATITATSVFALPGFVSVARPGQPLGTTSCLQVRPGANTCNSTLIPVVGGKFQVATSTSTHLIIDVIGYTR